MRYGTIAVVLMALWLQGCGEKPPPEPPKAEAPKDKSPEEYYQKIKGSFPDPSLLENLPEEVVLASIAPAVEALKKEAGGADTENKSAAKKRLGEELLAGARQFKEKEKWACVKAACDLRFEVTSDRTQTEKLESLAKQILARPKITVQGFMEVGSQLFILLQCRDLKTGQTRTFRVLESEDFGEPEGFGAGEDFRDKLKLSRVIGNREAVEIYDYKTKDTWEVAGPTGAPAPVPVVAPPPPAEPQKPGKKPKK